MLSDGLLLAKHTSRMLSLRFVSKEVLAANRCYPLQKQRNVIFISYRGLPTKNYGRTKEYSGRKLVGYSMESMFDVVADVGNYKQFLPFCKQSDITSKSENNITANLVIGFPPIVEAYTSHVTLLRPHLIKAVCSECRLIKHLNTTWKFSPGLRNNGDTCIIDFYVSFEFRSSLHSQLAHFFFNQLVSQMEGAFYEEAKARYGRPSMRTQFLGAPKITSS